MLEDDLCEMPQLPRDHKSPKTETRGEFEAISACVQVTDGQADLEETI